MFQSIRNYFATPPRRGASPLGAGLSDEDDDPAIPAFQRTWKDGALVEDLFGPHPFALHGSVGGSGADNHRPDVAKVETLLGDAGYYKPMTDSGPNGWHNPNLDSAIRTFQKDKGLQVDGLLKPGGPTITAIGGLFGGAKPQDKPDSGASGASGIVEGEWDWMDKKSDPFPTTPWPGTSKGSRAEMTTFPTRSWPGAQKDWPGTPPFFPEGPSLPQIPTPEIGQDAPEPTSRPDSAPLPDRPQGSDERVPVYGQDRAAIMPHVPTQEAIDRYQAEYEKWARENLDKIRMNEDLERRGLPTIHVPPPPRDPRKPFDERDMGDIIGSGGGYKPPRRPQPQQPQQQPPTAGNGPTVTMGGNGKPVIVLGGRPTRPRIPDLFPGHTISEAGAREHEDWAKLLKRDAKPEETARILNVAITDHGDQGAADAADLLGRFAQHDPQKAETLRTLVSRQAGREVPFRIAPLGEGFREPSMEEKLAQAPQSPFGPTDGADMEAAGSMAKALLKKGDYQDAYEYLKSAPEATPPYMAAVHDFMRRENPGLAMKFAEQGVQNGMAKPEAPPPEPPKPPPEAPLAGQQPGTPLPPPSTPSQPEPEKGAWDIIKPALPPAVRESWESMGQTAVKAAEVLSPGADIRDAVNGSAQTTQAIKQGDVGGAIQGTAGMLGGLAGVFLPGTVKGAKDGVKTVAEGIEGASRHTLPDASKAENPITAKEFAQLPDSGSIDPKRIRTMQDSAGPTFRDKKTLEATIEGLRNGTIKPEDIPPVRVTEVNGEVYTLDHRRLIAFREAGVPIGYQKVNAENVAQEIDGKMRTKYGGMTINIRKGSKQ